MTNPNPFLPKGSLLEQQSARRSRLKLGVFCVIAVSSLSLVAMLIQGCKRETPVENPMPEIPTNSTAMTDTNPPVADTNAFVLPTNQPPIIVPPLAETVPGSEYLVVKGDTLTTIAKAHHVSLKDLQAANPSVDSKHLKLKQKITIPAATTPAAGISAPVAGVETAAGETYTVKTGDTLTTIAKKHGTTVKALQAANNLTTTKIKVNQKLKLPTKAEVAPPIVDVAPVAVPALSMPAPAPVK
ncbi:MAG: hypothetical protein RL616_19 [Verrucomicrobiota bacterium]|jgi:LysM repeat protein